MKFDAFDLNRDILAAVAAQGYHEPTPIQEKAIPHVLEGRDLLGLAQTGTGKTAAFALPLIQMLGKAPRRRISVLVLAPTRELASQINESFKSLSRGSGLKSMAVFGGIDIKPQTNALGRGVEIVAACPGRLLDLLTRRSIDLSGVKHLVIDEADRLFDMGFLPDIRRIVRALPVRRQTMLFSATMPRELRRLADEMLHDAATVQIGDMKPASTVSHALYPVEHHLKAALLRELLVRTATGSVLVFTRTKHRAERLARQLSHGGFPAASLQGNLSQNRRRQAIDGFRSGAYRILVATDIAARGLDISTISHVINFDMPDTADAYTHRIGRTGRASRTGEAFTFVTRDDARMIAAIESTLGSPIARNVLPGFDYALQKAAAARPAPMAPRVQPKPVSAQRYRPGRETNRPAASRRNAHASLPAAGSDRLR